MFERNASQRELQEVGMAALADSHLSDRFDPMMEDTAPQDPVPDDFARLSPDVRPERPLSRFKAMAQKLRSVRKH